MRGPTTLSWQAVAIFLIATAGAVALYVLVPVDDPARGALITAFNGAVGAATVYFLGRRLDSTATSIQRTEEKVDTVVEQTNGHTPK
jgi:hypothetical protein